MQGISLTPNPPLTTGKEWTDFLELVKSVPGVQDVKLGQPLGAIWLNTDMTKKQLAAALESAGIDASVN